MSKANLSITIPTGVKERLGERARLSRRSQSSLAAEMLAEALNEGPIARAAAPDFRTHARLDKVIGEMLILKEVMLVFVRVWLEHNPPIDEAFEESAAASAEARFERFISYVGEALRSRQSLGNGMGEANGEDQPGAASPETGP